MRASGPAALGLRPGEWVEVRSEAEILGTLDGEGMVDGLPFMPEMRKFCGGRYRVAARADRTVVQRLGVRSMKDTVHLEELRCDGAAHDGCCRECLLYWKESWLRRPVEPARATPALAATALGALAATDGDGYICQATHLERATVPRPRLALQDLRAPAAEGLRPSVLLLSFGILAVDMVKWRLVKREWNTLRGPCKKTPVVSLGLQPGERVRVKSRREILATLDANGWNRGLEFSREMLPYCGRELTVLRRVERILLDQTTRMRPMKDTVILDGAVYRHLNRRAVPRREYMFWRECWLERV
ncbi:MAG: hypothetical protein JWN44_2237 [Myxococcales bacterium]|nr:hypothetical protein [Myxococcales bacterium]